MRIHEFPEHAPPKLPAASIAAKLQRLVDAGKSQAYIDGFRDALERSGSRLPPRPRIAELSVAQLDGGKIRIAGVTYPYKTHLKRLGGKWDTTLRAWVFPADAAELLHSDHELNRNRDLWSGVPESEYAHHLAAWDKMRDDYTAGSVAAQEIVERAPKQRTTFSHRPL